MKAMQEAGFVDVTATQVDIPMYVPRGLGLRDIFPYMVKPTPINVSTVPMRSISHVAPMVSNTDY